jgi:putative hemolysin
MGSGRRTIAISNVSLQIAAGRFTIRTISSPEELQQASALRYQVFQVEMIGSLVFEAEVRDDFDELSDHLAIFDNKSKQMIANCWSRSILQKPKVSTSSTKP